MKLGNTVFCLLLLGGLSTSCIREDLSDCFSTNTLLLSYKGDGETEIFGDKICRVEMYVFDAENRCVANGVLPPNEVEARAAKLPQLKPGDYRIVCLGNTHHTQVGNVASCDFSRITFADGGYFAGETVSGWKPITKPFRRAASSTTTRRRSAPCIWACSSRWRSRAPSR